MNAESIKLINILQDRFTVPERTDGNNILMTLADLERAINEIWEKDNNWTNENLWEALDNLDIPSFTSSDHSLVFILVRA